MKKDVTKTIFCIITMLFLTISLTACEVPCTRFNDVLNYYDNQIETIYFGSDTVHVTDTNPRFRIMLSWLQENQEYFSSRSNRRHEQNYLKIADEIIYFYGPGGLFTNFLDYYFDFLLQLSTTDIEWRYLTNHSVSEIIIEGVGQDFSFTREDLDINFILNLLEANQDQLYFWWNFDNPPAHSIEIILNNPHSHLNESFIFTNSVARFLIDDAFHDQLWTTLESEFWVMRDGDFSSNSHVSFVLNNRTDEITMLDFASSFGDWRRTFHRNQSGDRFEIVLNWLLENQEFLFDTSVAGVAGSVGKTINLGSERVHFYVWNVTNSLFWTFYEDISAPVDGYSLTISEWEYLVHHFREYIAHMWIHGLDDSLFMNQRNYYTVLRFFADNRDLIISMNTSRVEGSDYHFVSMQFHNSSADIGNRFLNRTLQFQITGSTQQLLLEAIMSAENFTTKHSVRDTVSSSNIDVSYDDWRYLARNFRSYIDFMGAGRTWARHFPFDNRDDLSVLLNFFAENYASLYNHTLVNANNLPIVYISFFSTRKNEQADSRFYNAHWQFHLSHELYDELEEIINDNFQFGGWIN